MKFTESNKEFIKELIHQVNLFDKECGLRLKHMDDYVNPDEAYNITMTNTQLYLAKILTALNGINAAEYFQKIEGMGMMGGPICVDDPVFIDRSNLEWDKNKKYDINSLMFKCRFLTLFISFMIGYIEEQAGCRLYANDIKIDPKAHMYFYVKSMGIDVKRLVICMLSDDYQNIIISNLFHSNYSVGKVTPKKAAKIKELNSQILAAIREIRENMGSGFHNPFKNTPDDFGIYWITRLAYMLSTRSSDLSPLPSFNDLEGATVNHDLVRVIRRLGECIIEAHKYRKRPVMYRAFNNAKPYISSNYKQALTDVPLSVGIRAIAYADFIINDESIHKFIGKMINHTKEKLE